MRRTIVPALSLLAILTGSCGGKPGIAPAGPSSVGGGAGASGGASGGGSAAGAGAKGAAAKPGGVVEVVSPALLLPDLTGDRGVIARDGGATRVLVDRMRLLVRDDGGLERAEELLPLGFVGSVALPSRLGGGYLFHGNAGGSTQIWRASSWLAKLKPLVQLHATASDVIAGFDRLYLRLSNTNRLSAINAETGELMGTGPLPAAAAYGQLAFADGWRAVVDTDLRGPLATFDAGATWRPVGVSERTTGIGVVNGDPTVFVNNGRYTVDARGNVTFARSEAKPAEGEAEPAKAQGPLGRRPIRAAVEDGWPDSATTAVVARGGVLARVSLRDGSVLATAEGAYPERLASCHAVRVGATFGFLCGERDGATTVYEFSPPLAMKPVMRFSHPRFVSASGNGSIVVRGTCADGPSPSASPLLAPVKSAPVPSASSSAAPDAPPAPPPPPPAPAADDARAYCVRGVDGATREIRVKGDFGVERVIALADGGVVVLVPPRGGSPGQLTILRGGSAQSVALRLPSSPRTVAREIKRGMWLDGIEERAPGVLSGWVEAGGPVVGVSIALDGTVKAGELRDEGDGAILSGRFGLVLTTSGRAAESTDGGMTWSEFDLPEREEEGARGGATRACGPAGCALAGWIRVGWGRTKGEDDARPADPPVAPYIPLRTSTTLALQCEVGASATPPPPPAKDKAREPDGIVGGVVGGVVGGGYGYPRYGMPAPQPLTSVGWDPFRNTPPPALASDEIGFGNGPYGDIVGLYAYAWGKKGADWSRVGRFRVRFDDRFDPAGGVRSSAITASLWADEAQAAEAIGVPRASYGGTTAWSGFLDPSGRAVLATACRGSSCSYFSAGDGQPVLPIRDAAGRTGMFYRPYAHGAVRVGETWFFLTQGAGYANDAVAIWRAELGVARAIGTYYRPMRYGLELPRLVRRALGGGIGILVAAAPDPGERSGMWYVLPVDSDTGELGEAVPLVRRDLGGVSVGRCAAGQDGWMLDTGIETQTTVELASGAATFDTVELRLRIDSGAACVDAIATRVDGLSDRAGAKAAPRGGAAQAAKAAEDAEVIPLAATERGTGRRWSLACRRKASFFGR